MRNQRRAQSAMEYLMTYGWAILIIAVVLGALFSLGVFGNNLTGSFCTGTPGYTCSNPFFTRTADFAGDAGTNSLSVIIGQNTGSAIYNLQIACASTTASTGYPLTPTSGTGSGVGGNGFYNVIAIAGNPYAAEATGATGTMLQNGQVIKVNDIVCSGPNGKQFNGTIGQSYSGSLFLNYTIGSAAVGGSNPFFTQKIANFAAKIVR